MKNAIVKLLYKNNRFRIVQSDTNYYLLDSDRPILGYVCFLFNWLIPQKVYVIDEQTADDLITQHIGSEKKNWLSLIWQTSIVIFFSLIIPQLLKSSYSNFIQFYQLKDVVLTLVAASLPAFIVRVYQSKQSKKSLRLKIKYHELPRTMIILKPITWSQAFKSLGIYLFFGLFVIISGLLLIILEGYWLISLCFLMILSLFSLTNKLAVIAGDYKISYTKEK